MGAGVSLSSVLPLTSGCSFCSALTSSSGSCKRGKSILFLHGLAAQSPPSSLLSPPGGPLGLMAGSCRTFYLGVKGMDRAWQGAAPWADEVEEGEGALGWCNWRHRRNLPGLEKKGKPGLKQ